MNARAPDTSQAVPGNQRRRRYSTPRTVALSQGTHVSNECLREHAFFKDSDPNFLELVFEAVKVLVCLPGEDIVKEGEKGDSIYFLYRGEVEVLVGQSESRVATLKDGSLFGEMALLEDGTRNATIRAISICDCRVISAKDFHVFLNRFPKEKAKIAKLSKERLAERNKTAVGKFMPRRPSIEAKQKFMRSARAILVSKKLEILTRLTAAGDLDSGALWQAATIEDMSLPRSLRSPMPPRNPRSPKSATESFAKAALGQGDEGMDVALSCLSPGRRMSAPDVDRANTQKFNLDNVLDNYIQPNLGALTCGPPTSQRPHSSRSRIHKVDTREPMQIYISRRSPEPPADWAPSLRVPTRSFTVTSHERTPRLLANLRDLRASWADAL